MKRFSCLSLLTLLFLALPVAAQTRTSGGAGRPTGGVTPGNTAGRTPNSINIQPTPLFVSGKVVVDDGTELTDQALVQSTCKGRRRIEGYTDSRGNFTFEFGKTNSLATQEIDTDYTPTNGAPPRSQLGRQWSDCELEAVLPGFTSQVIEMASVTDTQNANVGRIVLHRLAHVEGFTLSATSAAAPTEAKKAYSQARELETKKKWDKAQEKLKRAVEIYPHYAVAWYELGRVQLEKNELVDARNSFLQSVNADPKLVTPHQQLARLAYNEKKWQEVIDQTQQVLSLNPISFPQDWFLNGLANYLANRFDDAEKSARQGLKADVQGSYPKLEYLLGMTLLHKHNLAGAQQHLRNYVQRAPHDPEAAKVQEQIAQLDKAVGAAAPGASAAPQD
jgi:tetratricopeptide (TPR) repeat protein